MVRLFSLINCFTLYTSRWMKLAVLLGITLFSFNLSAQVLNGSFESGTLSSWTAGGTNRVAVVQNFNFSPGPMSAIPEGSYFVALSTGPGTVNATNIGDIDANGTNEFDLASLQQTVSFNFSPAILEFDWNFPSSEQNQVTTQDDLFDVTSTIGTTTTRVFSRSSCRNSGSGGISPFIDAPCTGLANVPWTIINAAPITGTTLNFGVGAWRHACVVIPNTTVGTNTRTILFRLADQANGNVDSALLLDNIKVGSSCDATAAQALQQLTITSGSQTVLKNGGFTFTPADNYTFSTDNTGTAFALASNANLTGDNPNFIPQVYIYDNAAFTRITGLTIGVGGEVQAVSLSGPTSGSIHGRYVAIAAKINASASLQIYRWDRSTSQLTQVTNSTTCDNTNPTISSDGTYMAWETTCNVYTGAGATRKIVYSIFSTNWQTPINILGSSTCTGSNPRLSRGNPNRLVVFVSNCSLIGGTPNPNGEIFQYNLNNANVTQVTTSTNPIYNSGPILDGSNSSRYTYFISNGNYAGTNADQTFEIFRYDANGGGSFKQVTSSTSDQFITVHSASDSTGTVFSYERILSPSGLFEVGVGTFDGTTTSLKPAAFLSALIEAEVGIDVSNTPVVVFRAGDNPLPPGNTDGNFEIFSARVQ